MTATRCASCSPPRPRPTARSAPRGTAATTTANARPTASTAIASRCRAGRSLIFPRAVRLDTRPPRPRVLSIGPIGSPVPRPELLPVPGGGEATIRLYAPGGRLKVSIHKLARAAAHVVERPRVSDGATKARWDGRLDYSRAASPGRYVVGVETRNVAGNIGRSPALSDAGVPLPATASASPARAASPSATSVRPPASPTRTGEPATFGVDARAQALRWRIRRVGARARRGAAPRAAIRCVVPPGTTSGVLSVRRDHRRSAHDGAVRGPGRACPRRAGRAARHDVAGPQSRRRRRRRRAEPARRRRRGAPGPRLRGPRVPPSSPSARRRCWPGWRTAAAAAANHPEAASAWRATACCHGRPLALWRPQPSPISSAVCILS